MRTAIGFLATALVALVAPPAEAAELPVDLELVLAVDSSPSIGISEFFLQRRGYVAAFRNSQLIEAIRAGHYGRIAVTYIEWAGPASQRLVVPWTLIDGSDSAATFAALLEGARSYERLGTSISGAIAYAAQLFGSSRFAGERLVIDVSGNGPNVVGPPVAAIRDAVVAQGITINGLPLMLTPDDVALGDYYRRCVIGGVGAFVLGVERSDDLEAAIRKKLIMEVAARPTGTSTPVIRVSGVGDGCDD